jgi:hypothetical protein
MPLRPSTPCASYAVSKSAADMSISESAKADADSIAAEADGHCSLGFDVLTKVVAVSLLSHCLFRVGDDSEEVRAWWHSI